MFARVCVMKAKQRTINKPKKHDARSTIAEKDSKKLLGAIHVYAVFEFLNIQDWLLHHSYICDLGFKTLLVINWSEPEQAPH